MSISHSIYQIAETKDGSNTVISTHFNQSFHSMHGALQESLHVFIKEGLHYYIDRFSADRLQVFEMGYGTGLNAMLTYISAENLKVKITYNAVEGYPIGPDIAGKLNYSHILGLKSEFISKFHSFDSNGISTIISGYFTLKVYNILFEDIKIHKESVDIIYYDAFSPNAQPELWSEDVMKACYQMLKTPGIWVTYSSKGDVKRGLLSAGFQVEKIPGPPGKREMLRALKV